MSFLRLSALATILALCLSPSALGAKTPTASHGRPTKSAVATTGRKTSPAPTDRRGPLVTYLTAHTAYLGMGSRDGVQVGMALPLRRNRQIMATCQVSSVAEHYATCPVQGSMRVGDTFAPPPAPVATAPETKALPALMNKEEAAHASEALASATFAPVPYSDTRSTLERLAAKHLRAELNVAVGFFTVNTQPDPNFNVLSVNAAVRGADLGGGFQASIDLTALGYLQRPPTFRFPELSQSQLFVRQLELSYRTNTFPVAFKVGRIWPYLAPSVGVLDGAQAGWHNAGNTFEGGLLGGTTPNGVTTAPTWDYPLVGAYFSSTQVSRETNSWLQASAVVTARELPGYGWHYAVDALGIWSLGKWLDTGAEVRLGSGVLQAPDFVEFASFDINVRPSDRSQISGTVRYLNDTLAQFVQPAGVIGTSNSSLRANASFFYDFQAMTLQLLGVYDRDIVAGLYRTLGGVDLTFPRLLGHSVLIGAGGDAAVGWYAGYDGYLQATLFPQNDFQLLLRGTYFYSFNNQVSTAPVENGLAGTVEARYRVARWFSVQATGYTQVAITPQTDGLPTAVGINVSLSATAHF